MIRVVLYVRNQHALRNQEELDDLINIHKAFFFSFKIQLIHILYTEKSRDIHFQMNIINQTKQKVIYMYRVLDDYVVVTMALETSKGEEFLSNRFYSVSTSSDCISLSFFFA